MNSHKKCSLCWFNVVWAKKESTPHFLYHFNKCLFVISSITVFVVNIQSFHSGVDDMKDSITQIITALSTNMGVDNEDVDIRRLEVPSMVK